MPSEIRLEFVATVFVRECLRHYRRLHPNAALEDMPMRAFAEYPARDQKALIGALAKAIEASDGMNDAYRVFVEQRLELARARAEQPRETGD